MLIRTEFELACSADVAWHAVHSPRQAAALYSPLVRMVAPEGMPDHFRSGDRVTVRMTLFGLLPLGRQIIDVEDDCPAGPAGEPRTMRDRGGPISGPLALLSGWRHEMTLRRSPRRANHTLWRDELTISGGAAILFWPVLALMWRWRQRKLTRMAKTWNSGAD